MSRSDLPLADRVAPAATRDFRFTTADFRTIAGIARAEAGIVLPDVKEPLVYSRLAKRLRRLRLPDFASYCALISSDGGAEERLQMISALTTNVTHFFREMHHFRHLAEEVLPELVARARDGGRVRFWSAGCSSGEEAYSLALCLLRACPEAATLDIKILATDIDPQVLEKARLGRYAEEAVQALPDWVAPELLDPPDAEGRRGIGRGVRDLVSFRRLNLIRPWPFQGPFDVIFCRNVAIYFDAETQSRLWQGFAAALAAGGHLYIGHSERLSDGLRDRFAIVGMTSYRHEPDGGLTPAAAAPPVTASSSIRPAQKGDEAWH